MHWGVEMARKGGVPPDRVLNAMPLPQVAPPSSTPATVAVRPSVHCGIQTGKQSAGLLLYRRTGADIEVLLGHPGGPFWRNKDLGSWTISKGLIAAGETPLAAAKREFAEETGHRPHGKPLPLAKPSSREESLFRSGRSRTIGMLKPQEPYV